MVGQTYSACSSGINIALTPLMACLFLPYDCYTDDRMHFVVQDRQMIKQLVSNFGTKMLYHDYVYSHNVMLLLKRYVKNLCLTTSLITFVYLGWIDLNLPTASDIVVILTIGDAERSIRSSQFHRRAETTCSKHIRRDVEISDM